MESLFGKIDYLRTKMKSDMDKLVSHYDEHTAFVQQSIRQGIIDWAKVIVDHPKALFVIIETTPIVNANGSVLQEHEPIRFTSFDPVKDKLYDQMFAPTHSKEVRGTEHHGLTLADVENEPRLADVWPSLAVAIFDRQIVIFGADWARHALTGIVPHAPLLDNAFCLHNKCKDYYGEFYYISLEKVLGYQGIDKKREELNDSRDRIVMHAQILENLAAGMEKQEPAQEEGLDDLPDHPF